MRKDYQDVIVSELTSPKKPSYIQFNTESGPLAFDITMVENLLSQPETKIWYDNYYSGYDHVAKTLSEKSYFSLVSSVQEDLIDELNPRFEQMLYRIAQFKFELMPEFSFFGDVDVHSIPRKELIITGDEVLNFKSGSRVEFNNTADLLGPLEQKRIFVSNVIPKGSEINEKQDNWEYATLKLYLSESMRYHLWIRLDAFFHYDEPDLQETIMIEQLDGIIEDGLVRNIVIKDLCRMNFLKEIEIIRKWCGWHHDFNDDIKREVAKVGGYVPGAEVL